MTGGPGAYTGPLAGFFENLRRFLQRNMLHTRPRPFEYWSAETYVLAAGSLWLDQHNYLQGRRSWAVVNHQYFNYAAGVAPTAVDYVYCNSVPIGVIGQGLWIYPNGGVLSNPIGHGDAGQRVHVSPGTAGTSITFLQYA